MKRWLRMAAAGAALLMGAAGLTGCSGGSGQSGGGDGEKTVLKISFFKGGYGDECQLLLYLLHYILYPIEY